MEERSPDPRLSRRSSHLREASLLRALTTRVNAFDDGINLGQGICDLEMPRPLRLAAVESLFQDRATYTAYSGVKVLREQIVRRNEERYGLRYGLDEVVVTTGSSGAYSACLMALFDPGDELVLCEPFYPYHYTAAILAGANVRCVPLDPNKSELDWDALDAALAGNPKAMVLNTPGNPSGKVWTKEEIDRLATHLEGKDTLVITDEIYEDLCYDGREHVPPATHPKLYERAITISGLSKSFSITGWRIGWLAAPLALARGIGPVFDLLCVCAARPLQKAAAVALRELPESYFHELRDGYERRRGLLHDALAAGGLRPMMPQGAYYMLADYSERYGDIDPTDACFKLLDEVHLAAIPASIFWSEAPPTCLRFQFAVEEPVIAEVHRRLAKAR